MGGRTIIAALLVTVLAPFAAAQQTGGPAFQPVQTQTPAAPPKPKPAPAKKPAPAIPEVKARLLERVKDWAVYVYEGPDGRVCFAASAPTDMQPRTAKRTHVIFYVTTWQKDRIQNEVSVRQGYAMKAKAVATVTVGGQDFALSTEEEKAYPKDPADEQKLLAAMAGGGPMIVKATSAKGTATTDQYSADGVSLAFQKMKEACP